MWFTHMVDPASTNLTTLVDDLGGVTHPYFTKADLHEVVGTWSPALDSEGWYDVVVHIPSHGANTFQAKYEIFPGVGDDATECNLSQSALETDSWASLGNVQLTKAARAMRLGK